MSKGFNTDIYKIMKGSHHWKETCFLCNQWILKDEEFYLIIIPNEIRKNFNLDNFIVHKEEWDEFIVGLTDEEIAEKLLSHKKPRRAKLTEEQLENIECFKRACEKFGYDKCVISKDKRFAKIGKRKTSFKLIYDIVFDKISSETRAREGLFDGLFNGEFVAKVCNAYYEEKGIDKHEDFTAMGVIQKAIEDTNKLMGK